MTQSAKAQEPSMEEILASIRRIIADDDSSKAAPAAAKPVEPPKPAPPPPAAVVPPPAAPIPPAPPRVPLAPPAPRPAPAAANNQQDIDAMLADLDAPPKMAPPPMPVAPPKMAPPMPDVLDLTEAMTAAAAPPPAPNFRTIDGANDVIFTDRASEPAPEPPPRAERAYTPPPPPPAIDQALISQSTMSAVDTAFNSLANTVLGNNARTLEDLVKEMLRPMLKNWLDDNLPSMVERIVRAEIERVSRGRP
jgi:cell pole-organizing protein PopZ